MSSSLHARVLLGNEPLPQFLEIKNFEPFKQMLNKYQFSAVVMALAHQLALIQGPTRHRQDSGCCRAGASAHQARTQGIACC